jgi:hypothetical protein
MSLTVNAATYAVDSSGANVYTYAGPAKTLTVKDDVRLLRIDPKPTATFSGVCKTSMKITRTLTLTGALTPTWDAIVEVSVSVPVGFTAANVDTLLSDVGAFVASAQMKTLAKNKQIAY